MPIGCVSSTQLRTTDPDAIIYTDTNKEKKESLTIKDGKPFFSKTVVRVKKENCQTESYTISKSDDFFPEPLFMGIYLATYIGAYSLLSLLWMTTYEPTYLLDYQCRMEKIP